MIPPRIGVSLALALISAGPLLAQAPERSQITALAKSFLRDSAELPMDVIVTTVVKDAAGKQKRNATENVRFLFKGYNSQTGRWSFRSTSGFFGRRVLYDSAGGNFAVLDAFTSIGSGPDGLADLAIEGSGDVFIVRAPQKDCHQFEMSGGFLYAEKRCYSTEFYVRKDAAGALSVERFMIDIGYLPATGRVRYLGAAQILKIHAEGEVQQAHLPDDPRPFLIPKRVVTTIATDKGTVLVTNAYTLRAAVSARK